MKSVAMNVEKKNKAPKFADKLRLLLKDHHFTQRKLSKALKISASSVNRLCKDGVGSEKDICIILTKLGILRRRVLEMLTDRRAELCEEPADKIWGGFRFAYLNAREYLEELCPLPLEIGFVCTHLGITLQDLKHLTGNFDIKDINNLKGVPGWKFLEFIQELAKKHGEKAREMLLSRRPPECAPVLFFEFETKTADSYKIPTTKCHGDVLFGLPHMVLTDYTFAEGGEIGRHRNHGGVEMIYSVEGVFELTCADKVCMTNLKPKNGILLYEARYHHSIRLIKGKRGRLLVARFDPKHRIMDSRPPGRRKITET